MKFAVALCIACFVAVVKAQYGFGGSFGGFKGFGNGLDAPLQSARDPRENPGPVVFPPAPPDSGETSGVVVGASGYGFVPPHRTGAKP
ncbi:uncharacterized protein LOC108904444 isoform X2 [Anoplophora glabripennis]|uniref:uncharacterized protein LOC108904444 isoform X2 n=1 Tax=Anoplophora glabripennis TaxID=217634 RepID=UPI0008735FBA|nr:uncharacterized protein LOC108904444 isoform X2 [Anoplophora glabripennis]